MRHLIICLAALVVASCETTDVAPMAAGTAPSIETDEAGLWYQVDKAEDTLKTAAVVVRDPELNAYVKGVACKVTGPDYCDDLRLYIIEAPYLNASMAPNGLMQVWTGLLLRAENEAQLAFVLGHEFLHYQERHSLEQFREYKNAANASLLFGVTGAVAGVPEAAQVGSLVLTSQIYGFGRDKEREADEGGFDIAVAAGYDPNQAAALWHYVIDEVAASSSRRKQRKFARASVFSTHPLTEERVETLEAMAANHPEGGYTGREAHRAAVSPFLDEWLDHDIARRDMGEHLFLIESLLERGGDEGVLWYRKGEAYRVRRETGDQERALEAYEKATAFDDAPAFAWREIGNAYRRKNDTAAAAQAYTTYLTLAPEATDRALVESYLTRWGFDVPSAEAIQFPALASEEGEQNAP